MIVITRLWHSFARIEKAILAACFCALLFFAGGFWSRSRNAHALPPVFTDAPHLKSASASSIGSAQPLILVHVAGEVLRPGVLQVASGARVMNAIQKAGGATKAGDLSALNLAEKLKDGQKIVVSKRGAIVVVTTQNSAPKKSSRAGKAPPHVVNVNTASAQELQTLPGVGPVMAERIVEMRAKDRIDSLDEMDEVKGLGPKKLQQIKPYVAF